MNIEINIVNSVLVIFLLGAVIVFMAYKIIEIMNDRRVQEALINAFGPINYVRNFSWDQAWQWIKEHDNLMRNGCDALIFKVINNNLSQILEKFNVDFDRNRKKYLVITISRDKAKDFEASLLVSYKTLDSKLEQKLAPGHGSFLVEGVK